MIRAIEGSRDQRGGEVRTREHRRVRWSGRLLRDRRHAEQERQNTTPHAANDTTYGPRVPVRNVHVGGGSVSGWRHGCDLRHLVGAGGAA